MFMSTPGEFGPVIDGSFNCFPANDDILGDFNGNLSSVHALQRGSVNVVVGEQRGDEGKGRFVDELALQHDIVARYNGGPNAGHTVVLPDGRELSLHGIPSGVAHDDIMNVIGNGVLIDPTKMSKEIDELQQQGIDVSPRNLKISSAAHLILPHHIGLDVVREQGDGKQGSTKSGIAQAAADKAMRIGARAEWVRNEPKKLYEAVHLGISALRGITDEDISPKDIADQYVTEAQKLGGYITDTVLYLNEALKSGESILAEGAQAFWLDLDHGMFPFTTSSSPTSGGVATGLGIPPTAIGNVLGVVKATPSHVGDGPFMTEIEDEDLLAHLRGTPGAPDYEAGTTTKRLRRMGYLDLPAWRRAQMVNGTTEAVLTKLDRVTEFAKGSAHEGFIPVCVSYERKHKTITVAPDSARKLEQSKPNYVLLPAWDEDISEVRDFADLPLEAQDYVEFLEDQTCVPITRLGVGPSREQVINR